LREFKLLLNEKIKNPVFIFELFKEYIIDLDKEE